jgi:peptidyl-prolyl cis-trans isomerase SurA
MTRHVLIFLALLALLLPAGPGLAQQNPFAAALTVNGRAITWWELDQRQRLLEALNAPGDAATLAREGLIDDRLRAVVAERLGFRLPEDELQAELEEFAARGNLPYDQLLILLDREGVAPETLRDFVRWQATWAAIVRGRFAGEIAITEEEIDRALALARAGSGTSVLLSELVLPLTPQLAAQNRSLAERLSETLDGFDAFAEAARRLSVAPSAADGGRLDWVPLSEFPPEIGSLLLSLAPGEITPPLNLPQVIVLFQLRDLREQSVAPPSPSSIDYVEVLIPGPAATAGEIAGPTRPMRMPSSPSSPAPSTW